jgi:hypothetical protein
MRYEEQVESEFLRDAGILHTENYFVLLWTDIADFIAHKKVKFSPLQALEALRVVRV